MFNFSKIPLQSYLLFLNLNGSWSIPGSHTNKTTSPLLKQKPRGSRAQFQADWVYLCTVKMSKIYISIKWYFLEIHFFRVLFTLWGKFQEHTTNLFELFILIDRAYIPKININRIHFTWSLSRRGLLHKMIAWNGQNLQQKFWYEAWKQAWYDRNVTVWSAVKPSLQ